MREILFGVVLGPAVAVAILIAAAWPASGRPVVAIFASGSTPNEIMLAVEASGGQTLSVGIDRPVVVSIADTPDHVASLYRQGAWLVADAALAKLCFRLSDDAGSLR